MKSEIKQKWVEALRSDKYAQGKFRLYDGTNYCCLGILCELYLKETGETWGPLDDHISDGTDKYYIDGESEVLPGVVGEWAGVNGSGVDGSGLEVVIPLPEPEQTMKVGIISLNDDLDYTFPQIADLIEAQL